MNNPVSQNISLAKQVGSIFVVIGTEIGAGILALPILIAHIGFPLACLIMLCAWMLTTYTALLICEVNLSCEDGANFASMAKKLLGPSSQVIVWLTFLLLLYMIIVAYVSAAGSALSVTFGLNTHLVSLLFVLIFGSFVVFGTGVVDIVNRGLLGTKLILLIFVCLILIPHVKLSSLAISFVDYKVLLLSLPVFVTSFISHLIIPPLRSYLHSNVKVLTRVIIIGSVIPLILYIIWIISIIGVIPYFGNNSFTSLFAINSNPNVGDILQLIKVNLNNTLFYTPISLFSNISLTTSFLGVSLALYHFIIDGFKLKSLGVIKKTTTACILTFLIPLLIVWFLPNIFIKALAYIGVCCAILLIIIPVIMIFKLKQQNHKFKIPIASNNILLSVSFIIACLVIIIQFI